MVRGVWCVLNKAVSASLRAYLCVCVSRVYITVFSQWRHQRNRINSATGRLAQLVERTLSMREVEGSKPSLSTTFYFRFSFFFHILLYTSLSFPYLFLLRAACMTCAHIRKVFDCFDEFRLCHSLWCDSDVRVRVSTGNGERSVLLSESIGMWLYHNSRRRYGKQSDDATKLDTKKVERRKEKRMEEKEEDWGERKEEKRK